MRSGDCVKPLLERRSVRRFEDRPVPLETLLEAVDVARHAPSAYNRQPWEFILITRRETLRRLAETAAGGAPLRYAPAGVAVVGDTRVSPHTYVIDCSIAATYLWLALHCLGLGAVWIEVYGNERAEELLRVPPGKRLVALFAVGWPAVRPRPTPRRSLEELVHLEEYGKHLEP